MNDSQLRSIVTPLNFVLPEKNPPKTKAQRNHVGAFWLVQHHEFLAWILEIPLRHHSCEVVKEHGWYLENIGKYHAFLGNWMAVLKGKST